MKDTEMRDTEIVEVLEDGTIYHFDTDVCNEAANEAVALLWEKEGNVLKFDFTASVFDLFTQCVGILTNSGWDTEELIAEVIEFSEADDVDNFLRDD